MSFIIISCDVDSPTSLIFNSPQCSVQNITQVEFPDFPHFPRITITVINNGDGPTAYHTGCIIRFKNGNHILDDGIAVFGTLYNGESRSDEVWFSDLEETDIVTSRELILYWYDAENNYYESTIN
jgi:hypothetical protein